MTVKELVAKLTDIATLFGNLDVRFSNQNISAPVLDVAFQEGAQFVTLIGDVPSIGNALWIVAEEQVSSAERVG